MLCLFHCIYL